MRDTRDFARVAYCCCCTSPCAHEGCIVGDSLNSTRANRVDFRKMFSLVTLIVVLPHLRLNTPHPLMATFPIPSAGNLCVISSPSRNLHEVHGPQQKRRLQTGGGLQIQGAQGATTPHLYVGVGQGQSGGRRGKGGLLISCIAVAV